MAPHADYRHYSPTHTHTGTCRQHPHFKITAVPTLFKWGKGKPVGSLVEDQCKSATLVAELVTED